MVLKINNVMTRITSWRCDLELYLNNRFMDIPGVVDLDPIRQYSIRILYDHLVALVLSRGLPDLLLARYTAKKGLNGSTLWKAIYNHFGRVPFNRKLNLLLFSTTSFLIQLSQFLTRRSFQGHSSRNTYRT